MRKYLMLEKYKKIIKYHYAQNVRDTILAVIL